MNTPTGSIRHVLQLWLVACLFNSTAVAAAESGSPIPIDFTSHGLQLVGDLYLPKTEGPHPALVFTHGSGGSGRDNRRHRTEAEHYARHGIASLVFDKRGYGDSEGDWQTATFEDLADDALAAVAYLKSRPEIDPQRIGLRGASQAGWILPIAAARSSGVAQLILISPAGVTPYQQIVYDVRTDLEDAGYAPAEVERALVLLRSGLDYARGERTWQAHAALLEGAAGEPWLDIASGPPVPDHWLWDWVRPLADFDAVPLLADIRTPVLVILGEADRVCPSQVAGYRMAEALGSRQDSRYRIRYFPGASHDLEVVAENGEEVLTGGYLDTIVQWTLEN